jgi:hypothetical protein
LFSVRGPVRSGAVGLINKKRAGQPITKKERPAAGNVVDLMDALRRSVGGAEPAKLSKPSKKPRKQLLFVVNGRLWASLVLWREADIHWFDVL